MSTRHRTGVHVPDAEFPDYSRKPERERPACKAVKYDRNDYPKHKYKANWRLYPKGCRVRGVLKKGHGEGSEPYVTKLNREGKSKISANFRTYEFGTHTFVDIAVGENPESTHEFLIDTGATVTAVNKETAIALKIVAPNWNPTKGFRRAGSNGTFIKASTVTLSNNTSENTHVFLAKELDIYIHGVKIETIKNINVTVTDDGSEALLGATAIGKLKSVRAFKALKDPDKWTE